MAKRRKKPGQDKWFVAAEITENIIFIMGTPIKFFLWEWHRIGLGNHLNENFTYFKGDFSQMWFRRSEFDAQADELSQKMLQQPRWGLRTLANVERWSGKFMQASRALLALPIEEMSDTQLLHAFRKVLRWHILSHGVGAAVSWMADADQERVSKGLEAVLTKQIKKYGNNVSLPKMFSVLTTLHRPSFVAQEEKDFLLVAEKIRRSAKVRQHLLQSSPAGLEKDLHVLDAKIFHAMQAHYEKWCWLPYAYKGPAYSFRYFLTRWKELLKSGESPKKLLAVMQRKEAALKRKQEQYKRALHLSGKIWQLMQMGQMMVFIKEYRKGALYHGMYCYEPLFREIARRKALPLDLLRSMNPWEIEALLQGKRIPSKKELTARNVEAVAFCDRLHYRVYTGTEAKRFMRSIPKEETMPAGELVELQGSCASPGAARGRVKIIEVPSDIPKMKKGDILVSQTTYPSLVPAMKLAAAIVTNAGGLTSHAAIVSRELVVPCVVGTKVANKVLKDGDRVEVDATEGVVRRI